MQNTIVHKQLKEHKLKATKARIAILEYFHTAKIPLDAESIKKYIEKKNISADMATIYRFLNTFIDNDMLKKVEFQEGKYRYELSQLPHHHHLVCTNCGNVNDVENCDLEKLEKNISSNFSFTIRSHNLEFFGLCSDCQ